MHSHLAKMIGQYLFDERSKKNLLQKEVAEKLGLSAQFLGRIEKGDVMVPQSTLIQLIEILKLSEKKMIQIYQASANLEAKALFTNRGSKNRTAPVKKSTK